MTRMTGLIRICQFLLHSLSTSLWSRDFSQMSIFFDCVSNNTGVQLMDVVHLQQTCSGSILSAEQFSISQ